MKREKGSHRDQLESQARPVVLVVGGMDAAALETLKGELEVRVAAAATDAWPILDDEEIAVGLLGPDLRSEAARTFLAEVKSRSPALATRFIVLAAGSNLSLFQDFVDDDTVFFLTESPVVPQELLAIVRSAATAWTRSLPGEEGKRLEPAQQLSHLRAILDVAERLAVQNDALAVTELAGDAARYLVSAERAHCLVYDPRDQVLRGRGPRGEERNESAAAGIVSFVARTGLPTRVSRTAQDSRYDRDADDPQGGGDERLLAVPVSGSDTGRVLAVIVAVRGGSQPEFRPEDAATLGLLARHVGPVLDRLALHVELERAAAAAATSLSRPVTEIYREEALRYHVSAGDRGDLLRLSERWMSWSYRLIGLSVVVGLGYLVLGNVDEYAAGPAVVRVEGTDDVAARAAGTVPEVRGQVIAVFPGSSLPKLRPGQPLRIELSGFPHATQRFAVQSVADEVVGREEAQRYLGRHVSVDLLPPGPVVVVRAGLGSATFQAGGYTYRYHDGMVGKAEVRVQSERLLVALVPSLKAMLE
jgi:hypothetical protein